MAKKTTTTATDNGSWATEEGRAERNASHLEALETRQPKQETAIVLPKLDIRVVELKLVGDSELIVHNWSEKAIKEMLGKQMGEASAGREHKNPVEDFLGSLYTIEPGEVKGAFSLNDLDSEGHPRVWIEGGKFGLPSIAFKSAAVEACTSLGKGNITKVAARQCFHVVGELVVIEGCNPRMRMDSVRLSGGGKADIRFRAGFKDWFVRIQVRYNARLLSVEQVANLFSTAGFAVGVAEWRPECNGPFGLFHVA